MTCTIHMRLQSVLPLLPSMVICPPEELISSFVLNVHAYYIVLVCDHVNSDCPWNKHTLLYKAYVTQYYNGHVHVRYKNLSAKWQKLPNCKNWTLWGGGKGHETTYIYIVHLYGRVMSIMNITSGDENHLYGASLRESHRIHHAHGIDYRHIHQRHGAGTPDYTVTAAVPGWTSCMNSVSVGF
jgi:hypothetical protein